MRNIISAVIILAIIMFLLLVIFPYFINPSSPYMPLIGFALGSGGFLAWQSYNKYL